jgi:hypothetical protein
LKGFFSKIAATEKAMKNTVLVMMILGGALSRLIPHVPNLTAITAIALLGGAAFSSRTASIFVPLAAMWISDLILGFHNTMPFVYFAVALISLASGFALKGPSRWARLPIMTIASSLFFFIVTNFGVWMMDSFYPKTAGGLVTCYDMALPFLGTQVLGDLFYTGLIFGAVSIFKMLDPQVARA